MKTKNYFTIGLVMIILILLMLTCGPNSCRKDKAQKKVEAVKSPETKKQISEPVAIAVDKKVLPVKKRTVRPALKSNLPVEKISVAIPPEEEAVPEEYVSVENEVSTPKDSEIVIEVYCSKELEENCPEEEPLCVKEKASKWSLKIGLGASIFEKENNKEDFSYAQQAALVYEISRFFEAEAEFQVIGVRNSTLSTFGIGLNAKKQFDKFVPYVGAGVYYLSATDNLKSSISPKVWFRLKVGGGYVLNKNVAFYAELGMNPILLKRVSTSSIIEPDYQRYERITEYSHLFTIQVGVKVPF